MVKKLTILKFCKVLREIVPENWVRKVIWNEKNRYQIQYRLQTPKIVKATIENTKENTVYDINPNRWWERFNRYTLKLIGISFTIGKWEHASDVPYYIFVHALIESRPYRHKYFDDHDYNIANINKEFESTNKIQIPVDLIQKYVQDFIKLTKLKK